MYRVTYQAAFKTQRRIKRLCSFLLEEEGEDSSQKDLNLRMQRCQAGCIFGTLGNWKPMETL